MKRLWLEPGATNSDETLEDLRRDVEPLGKVGDRICAKGHMEVVWGKFSRNYGYDCRIRSEDGRHAVQFFSEEHLTGPSKYVTHPVVYIIEGIIEKITEEDHIRPCYYHYILKDARVIDCWAEEWE